MTVTNTLINNLAKALNSESFTVPTRNIVATEIPITLDITSTTLSGLLGTGDVLSGLRSNNTVTFTAVRSGASVEDVADGDNLQAAGIFDGTLLQIGVPITELHTTSFDMEFVWDITINRGN
jgi:hypothetical protein